MPPDGLPAENGSDSAAQVATPPNGSETSTPDPSAPVGNGTTTGNASSGGWLDGLVDLPTVPSGWELLSGMIQGFISDLSGGAEELLGGVTGFLGGLVPAGVDTLHGHLLTLPAPGDPYDMVSWGVPDDPFWIAVSVVYIMTSAFALSMLMVGGFPAAMMARRGKRRDVIRKVALAAFLIILGRTVLLPMWGHFWNQAALGAAPSGGEFMSTPGNVTKLGIGVVLGAVVLLVKSIAVIVGLGIHLAFVFLTFATFALWPVGVVLWVSDLVMVQTLGTAIMAAYLALGPLQFFKALVLRMVFEMPLSLSVDSLWTFLFITIGVLVAFVGLPWWGLKAVVPHAVFSAGGKVRSSVSGSSGNRLGEVTARLPSGSELQARVSDARSGVSSRMGNAGSRIRDTSTRTSSSVQQSGGGSQAMTDYHTSGRSQSRMQDTSTRTTDPGVSRSARYSAGWDGHYGSDGSFTSYGGDDD